MLNTLAPTQSAEPYSLRNLEDLHKGDSITMTTYVQTGYEISTCIERLDLPKCHHHYRPRHTEILLVQLDAHQRITSINGVLHGIFVNALTKQELYRYSKNLGDSTLYAVESRRFPGFHYVVGFSPELGAFACSCYEAKFDACPHEIEIQAYMNEQVMLHA